jgi:hypothetical protein
MRKYVLEQRAQSPALLVRTVYRASTAPWQLENAADEGCREKGGISLEAGIQSTPESEFELPNRVFPAVRLRRPLDHQGNIFAVRGASEFRTTLWWSPNRPAVDDGHWGRMRCSRPQRQTCHWPENCASQINFETRSFTLICYVGQQFCNRRASQTVTDCANRAPLRKCAAETLWRDRKSHCVAVSGACAPRP